MSNPRSLGKAGDAPQLLRDMRAVYAKPADQDKTPGQMAARKLLDSDPKAFLAQMERLEKAHTERLMEIRRMKSGGEGVPAAPKGEMDRGTATCIAVCEELLEKWAQEDGAKSQGQTNAQTAHSG